MGNTLFGINIAAIVNQAIAPGLLPATLTKVTAGVYDPSDYTAGPSIVTADYSAKGIIENYSKDQIDGTTVQSDDKKVLLIGYSIDGLQVPAIGDKITIEGSTYDIIMIDERDPAAATYICQVR